MFSVINGNIVDSLPATDRGLLYGDGLFETLRYIDGEPVLFELHLARFERGAQVLLLELPEDFSKQLSQAIIAWKVNNSGCNDFICKWILTRGSGGRGYLPPEQPVSTLIFSFFPTPKYPEDHYQQGISATVCSHPLSSNPVLAGLKHLNRIDQVITSSQLGNHVEGITCDADGNIIEGTKSNILLFYKNQVMTPVMKSCGVDGCMLQYLLNASDTNSLGFNIEKRVIKKSDLSKFDGIAFVNSVFGLWPVFSLDGRKLKITPECRALSSLIEQKLGIY